jgi:lipopolysaccharide export system permease protein
MNSSAFKPSSHPRWSPLPVLDRMVTAELIKTILSVLIVLVTIIVSRKFLSILTKAIEGEVAGDTLFVLLGLKILSALIILLPAAVFLGILLVFGRMYRDHEMTVLSSAGVGYRRLYRAIAFLVIPLALLGTYLALQVMPWSERQVQELMKRDEKTADLRGIKPGRFNEFSQGDVVLYAEAMSETDGIMSKVFVQSRQGEKTGVIIAESGHLEQTETGEHFVVLSFGRRYQGTPGQADFVISEFEDYAVKIDEGEGEEAALKREAASSMDLWRSKTPRELAELQRRFAIPLGVLVLSFLAVPLSRSAPRGGVYGSVLTAFLIYLTYENLQRITQGLLMTQRIPVWLGYSGAYVVMLTVTLFFLVRANGPAWLWKTFRSKVRL